MEFFNSIYIMYFLSFIIVLTDIDTFNKASLLLKKYINLIKKKKYFWFIFVNVIFLIVIVTALIVDIIKINAITLNNQWQVGSQIITAILICDITIISISLSLKNEDFFGIKSYDFFKLRTKPYFDFLQILIIGLSLAIINMVAMLLNFNITLISTSTIAIIYSFWFLILEIPLLNKNEESIFKILKNALKLRIENMEAQTSTNKINLHIVLNNIITTYGILETYQKLSDSKNSNYNKILLENLFDERNQYLFNLDIVDDKEKIIRIFDATFNDIIRIVNGNFDIQKILKNDKEYSYSYLIIRAIFAMSRNKIYPKFNVNIERLINSIFTILNFQKQPIKNHSIINDILISLIIYPAQSGEVWALNIFKKLFSDIKYTLGSYISKENYETNLYFATICWYLYYLCEMENDINNDIKANIKTFINEKTKIVGHNKIFSWKELYENFVDYVNIDLSKLLNIYYSYPSWEFYLSGIGKSILLSDEFIINWFLELKINSTLIHDYDIYIVKDYSKKIQNKVKNVLDKWFNDDKRLKINRFDKYQQFYDYEVNNNNFINSEKLQNKWYELKNDLKVSELTNYIKNCKIENRKLEENLNDYIENSIKEYWGYNKNLKLEGSHSEYSYDNILEKFDFSTEDNFNNYIKGIGSGYKNSILGNIIKKIKPVILYNQDSYDDILKEIKSVNPTHTNMYLDDYYLKKVSDTNLLESFKKIYGELQIIKKSILPPNIFLNEKNFKFNFKINECTVKDLSDEQINVLINENYIRPDGQYYFNGVYVTREKLINYIKEKFITFKLVYKSKVEYNPNKLLIWDIWGTENKKRNKKKA